MKASFKEWLKWFCPSLRWRESRMWNNMCFWALRIPSMKRAENQRGTVLLSTDVGPHPGGVPSGGWASAAQVSHVWGLM